jgi:hypothetical protein
MLCWFLSKETDVKQHTSLSIHRHPAEGAPVSIKIRKKTGILFM